MTVKAVGKIERDTVARRIKQAKELAKLLTGLRHTQGQNTYELGGAFNHVLTTRLWDSWPRTTKKKGAPRNGYDTFELWCWNEMGERAGKARTYAAHYRRFRNLGLPDDDKQLHRDILALGIGKQRLVLRSALRFATVTDEGDPDLTKAQEKAWQYVQVITSKQMTEVETRALIQLSEEKELSIPEMRPPALPLVKAPLKRTPDWAKLDASLREVSYLAASCDKKGTIKKLEEALRRAKKVQG